MRLIQPGQDKKPFLLLALTALVTLSVLAFFLWRLDQYSDLTEDVMQRSLDVRELRGEIVYLDEALTMSARLAVLTGEPEWQRRYRKLESRLDAVLAKVSTHTGALPGMTAAAAKTDAANKRLLEMEHRAFDLLAQGQREAARKILFSAEYGAQKALYAEGMAQLDGQLGKVEQDARKSGRLYFETAIGSALVAIPLLALLWYYVLRSIRGWRVRLMETNRQIEQQGAELAAGAEALRQEVAERRRLAAEAELRRLNDTLELRVKERTAQLGAASEDLRRSANQLRLFRDLLDQSNDGIYIVDPATSRFLDVNEAACRDLHYTREELLQRGVVDIQTDLRDIAAWQAHVQELRAQGRDLLEFEALRKDGSRFPVEVSIRGVSVEDQAYIIAVVRDISGRKRSEMALQRALRAQHALSACNATLIHATQEQQLLADMCRNIIEEGGYRLAWIGLVEHDAGKSVRPVASAGYEAGYLESLQITWADSERGQGPTGCAVRSGKAEIAHDIAQNPAYGPWREQALQRGYASSIALPLKKEAGEVFGVLNIYAAEAQAFDAAEIHLLQELADDLAFGVLTLRTRRERDHYQLEHLKSADLLKKALIGTIRSIALTVEKRDPYTAGHQSRVANLAAAIAREMGLDADHIEGMKLGAMIHDIGKIYVPAEILNRPGRLSVHEFGMIKTHPEVGYDIIKDVKFPWPVALMVLQHHERMDGSGYPKGLKGEEIILEARILAVADVMEAITAHRPYRPALGFDVALAEIEARRGQLYDPNVVDACLRLFREKGYTLENNGGAQ